MQGKGQVIKTVGNSFVVMTGDGEHIKCTLAGRYRLEDLRTTNPVVVGDRVMFEISGEEGTGRILEVFERRNYIIRRSSKLSKAYQIIASNIDQVLLVVTLARPVTHAEFIDRYLVTAEAYNIPAILLFNKIDQYSSRETDKMKDLIETYHKIPYRCMAISALMKSNLEEVSRLTKSKTSLVAGVSGSGKSTLINSIDPELDIPTGDLSMRHKAGRHTTSHAEMHSLGFGGSVIDTPGIKGFGVTDMNDEPMDHYFPELFRQSASCRYHDCRHVNEPGCAVLEALEQGIISPTRYRSYLSLLEEQNSFSKYRR